jgi:hypothetical protein
LVFPADTLGTERVKGQKEQAVHAQCMRELEDRVQVSTTQQASTNQRYIPTLMETVKQLWVVEDTKPHWLMHILQAVV